MMFVDYSNQSGIDLLKELKILTNYDKEEDLILNNKINKDNYTIHEIEMNKYLENDLEDLYQNTNLKYDNFCNKIKLFETELTNLEKKIKKVYEDYNVTQTQKKKIEMNIQDYTNINNSFEENRNSKKNEMIRLEKDAQYQVEVINLVKKEIVDYHEIGYRCDISNDVSNVLSGQKHYLKTTIDIDQECYREYAVLVTKWEEKDKSLMDHIKNEKSLIPKTLNDIKNLKSNIVLYNNGMQMDKKIIVSSVPKSNTQVEITITHSAMFKLYIYYKMSFKDTEKFQELLTGFENKKENLLFELDSRTKLFDEFILQNDKNILFLENLNKENRKKSSEITDLKTNQSNNIEEYEEKLKYIKSEFDNFQEIYVDEKTFKLNITAKEIRTIFKENDLMRTFEDKLIILENKITENKTSTRNRVENINDKYIQIVRSYNLPK